MAEHVFGATAVHESIEYGRAGDAHLLMDAGIPSGPGPFPAAILVHGGAWVSGDRRAMLQPLFQPLSDAGIAWFTISYRFASGPMDFGAAIDDVEQAVRYIQAHASEFHVDSHRIALVGESAGGHLAAMAALRGRLNGSVRAVATLYSPTDLVALSRSPGTVPESIRNIISGSPWSGFVLSVLRSLSPIEHVSRHSPPFLFIHGTADTLVPFEQSVRMCEKLREAGGRCEVYPVKGAGHGLRWWSQSRDGYKRKLVTWLQRELSDSRREPVRLPAAGD